MLRIHRSNAMDGYAMSNLMLGRSARVLALLDQRDGRLLGSNHYV